MSSCCGSRPSGSCCKSDPSKESFGLNAEMKSEAASDLKKILARDKTILDIVESLGPQLTDSDVNERVKAVSYLTEVITGFPTDFLLEEEVSTLLAFFTARLQDSILLLTPTLKSLQFLASCSRLPEGAERQILTSIFKEVNVQSGSQEDRYTIYQIIRLFMDNRIESVKSMGLDFVLGFIQAMEGEKDPRCLMLVFELFRKICGHTNFDPLADDMFEVVACYFPISFEAPPNDPYGITSADLSKGLRGCVTAYPKFGPLCVQLVEENLREDAVKTKREAFLLLEEALNAFPPSALAESGNIFWDEIRKQVMTPRSSDLEQLALNCLESLVTAIAKDTDEAGRNANLVVLVGQIFRDCEPFLSNPEMQLLEPTNRILLSASKSDQRVANQLANRALPLFMEKYQTKQTAKKNYASLLLEWCGFLSQQKLVAPLFSIKHAFTTLLIDDMMVDIDSIDVKDIALQLATCLLNFEFDESYFSDDQCLKIANIVMDNQPSSTRYSTLYLRTLAIKRWSLVERQLFPLVESAVNETTRYLPILASLIFDSTSAKLMLPRILDHVVVVKDGSNSALADAFGALRLVMELNVSKIDGSMGAKRNWIPEDVLSNEQWKKICESARIAAEELAASIDGDQPVMDSLENVSNLAQDIILLAPEGLESFVIDQLLDGIDVNEFEHVSPVPLLLFIERIIAAMTTKEIQRHKFDLRLFADSDYVGEYAGNFYHTRMARINACIVNKLPDDAMLRQTLDDGLQMAENNINTRSIEQYAWICKAVLLRNLAPYTDRMFEKIIQWLNNDQPDIPASAVEGLRIILDDRSDAPVLSTRVGVQTTILAKQRIFSRAVVLLTKEFQACKAGDRMRYYFEALRIVLAYAPKQANCEAEIDKLLPLLLTSIQSDDPNVLISSVQSLEQLINSSISSCEKLHAHVSTVCTRLVEIAKLKTSPMELRSTALDCLKALASENRIPTVVLNPWRDQVARQLIPCLDDRKRFVRSKAVAARNTWLIL